LKSAIAVLRESHLPEGSPCGLIETEHTLADLNLAHPGASHHRSPPLCLTMLKSNTRSRLRDMSLQSCRPSPKHAAKPHDSPASSTAKKIVRSAKLYLFHLEEKWIIPGPNGGVYGRHKTGGTIRQTHAEPAR